MAFLSWFRSVIRQKYSNDQNINFLVDQKYICTSTVEKIIRAVNSNDVACDSHLRSTEFMYKSLCISSTVLECLELYPGLKFLNIGSENGYFNTLAGLLLGKLKSIMSIRYFQI